MTWTEQKPKKQRTGTTERAYIIDKRPYIEPKRICPHRTKKKKSIYNPKERPHTEPNRKSLYRIQNKETT